MVVKKAVILAGGLGTRMMPYSGIVAKEMLLLGSRPVLSYVIDEMVLYGVDEVIVVVSPSKTCIREYFGESVKYVVQEEAGGMVDALMLVENLVKGSPFLVVCGDTVMIPAEGMKMPVKRVMPFCEPYKADARRMGVVVEKVDVVRGADQGIVRPSYWNGFCFKAELAVEKPGVDMCPRPPYAIAGRYLFNDTIFDLMRRSGGKCLTEAIMLGISEGYECWCAPLQKGESRFDIGTFPGYIEAFREMTR